MVRYIGLAAGMVHTHAQLPTPYLLPKLRYVTLGSYTLDPVPGKADASNIVITQDRRTIRYLGQRPNIGLQEFLDNHLVPICETCKDSTNVRLSLAPTRPGELREMVALLLSHRVNERIIELEINVAGTNPRGRDSNEAIAGFDLTAIEELLKEAEDYLVAKAIKLVPRTPKEMLRGIVELCAKHDVRTIVSADSTPLKGMPRFQIPDGRLAGEHLFPETEKQLSELSQIIQAQGVPIDLQASGGITTAEQVVQLLKIERVKAVQVGTLYYAHGVEGEKVVRDLITETGVLLAES